MQRKTSMLVRLLTVVLLSTTGVAHAQYMPEISGAVGMLHNNNYGSQFFQPVIAPTIAAPMGRHVLAEARFDFRGLLIQDRKTGPYKGSFFKSTQYLQLDIVAAPRVTFVIGRYLTPFNTYNERLSAIWIQNLQDFPLIFQIGTRTTGSSDGVMVRTIPLATKAVQVNALGYFSVRSNVDQFKAARAAGTRVDLVFPEKRLEVGMSYSRFLQSTHYRAYGAHLYWLPWRSPLQLRSEYAHGQYSKGYWIEAAYRLSQWKGPNSFIGRIEPVFRMQQTFRMKSGPDSLPAAGTQQADFGLDFRLPHEVRINSSYSRRFTSKGNGNIWATSLTYRFVLPVWKERHK